MCRGEGCDGSGKPDAKPYTRFERMIPRARGARKRPGWLAAGAEALALGSAIAFTPMAAAQELPAGREPAAPPSTVTAPVPAGRPPLPGWPAALTPIPAPVGTLEPLRPLRFAPPAPAEPPPLQARIFLTVEGEFTDNANQQKTDRRSEYRTRVAPGMALAMERQQASLGLTYVPRFLMADGRAHDGAVEHDLTFRAGWKPTGNLSVNVTEDYLKSSDFRDIPNLGARRTGRGDYATNRASGEVAYLSGGIRAAASYANDIARDSSQAGTNQIVAHTARASLNLSGPQNTLGGSYAVRRGEPDLTPPYWEHTWEAFLGRSLTPSFSLNGTGSVQYHVEELDRGFLIGQARGGFTTSVGPNGSLSVQGGAMLFDPATGSTRLRPSGLASLTYLFASVAVTAEYERSFNARFQDIRSTGVSEVESASLRVSTSAFRDLTASLGGRWNWEKREQTTADGGPAGTTETSWDIEARIRYAILRQLLLNLGYFLTLRTAALPINEFLENRVQLSLTYTFYGF